MTRFHSDDYVNFLRVVSPDNMHDYLRELQRCEGVGVAHLRLWRAGVGAACLH